MGNNNSSYGNGHINNGKSRHMHHDVHHRGHGKWGASSSDLGESSSGGNRMRKGYLPTRGYHGHARLPSPHKVLPSVNPTSAAKLLKPTSNGAILHQGGTISGRKLLSELDPHSPEAEDLRRAMRKRSTNSCPGNGDMMNPASGRSTPNLSIMDYNMGLMMDRNGARRASSKGGSSNRDYDSEPDLRDIDDGHHHNHHQREDSSPQRSISPVPNSFTLIQESPAKKQIRTKKKGKAPPPPPSVSVEQLIRMGGSNVMMMNDMPCCSPHSPQLLSPSGESKKASRLFKTKAESRLAAGASGPRSPEICSDLEMSRGGMMRASMDANRFYRGDRDRSSVHSMEAGLCSSKSSAVDHSNPHLSSRKHSEGGGGPAARKASLGSTTTGSGVLIMNGNGSKNAGMSSRNNPEVKMSSNKAPLARDHVSASSSSAAHGASKMRGSGASNGAPYEPNGSNRNSTTGNNHNGSSNIISLINQSGIVTTNDEHVPKSHRVPPPSTNLLPPIAPYGQSASPSGSNSNNTNLSNNNNGGGKPSVNQKANIGKSGFISSSSSQTKTTEPLNGKASVGGSANNRNAQQSRRKTTTAPSVPTSSSVNTTGNNKGSLNVADNNAETSNKTMFYFGMDAQQPSPNKGNNTKSNTKTHQIASATVHQSDSDNNNNSNDCRVTKSMMGSNDKAKEHNNVRMNGSKRIISSNNHEKVSSTNSSELLQIKQDSGSFDTSERMVGDGLQQNRESSSELSSSDLDIPLNIRPTLPAKKLGLPRFSPTAAWRALDSPSRVSVSGRSYSSEEGYGHDRIQRYMRQIPPSRANNHERSAGDSGISAGDAGSPANPELIVDGNASTTINPPGNNPPPPPPPIVMSNGVGGGRQYKLRERAVTSNKHRNGVHDSNGNKCWTPEQDLDESSSSDFDDQQINPPHQLPHPLHHSNSNVATRVLPAGLATPPKLTTRNNLFERGRNSALGMVSDSDQYHLDRPGNLYVRSRKTTPTSSANGHQESHDEIKQSQVTASASGNGLGGASRYYRNLRSQPWKQANHLRQPSGNNACSNGGNANGSREFVGLDTNWFLSRSEPNSLNLIGSGEYDNIEQQELRLVLAEQDDDDEDANEGDDVEEELSYLPSEEDANNKQRTLVMMNMHGNGGGGVCGAIGEVVNNEYDQVDGCGGARLESEIGYGPSSMSFSSPLPSPSQVKINRNKANRRNNESSLYQQHHQQVVSTTCLAEEFERDQQDIGMTSPTNGANARCGDSSWERRPFSHIMYLPAYDSRRAASSSAGTRRTKSVDNLNFSEMPCYQPRKTSQYKSPISPNMGGGQRHHQRRSRSPTENSSRGRRTGKRRDDPDEPYERSQSVPPFTAEEENERRRQIQMEQQAHEKLQQQMERERLAEQKKKKFKFQSTLRVMERKKIEQQLSREAEEKERRRLEEQDQMRKVEEEFQRKRVKEKVLEMEAAAQKAALAKSAHSQDKIEMSNRYDVNFEPRSNGNLMSERNHAQSRGGNSNNSRGNSNISYTTTSNNNHLQTMFQRQEPEGAPASVNSSGLGDLRKELISASRNRSGFPGSTSGHGGGPGKQSELTQELSEFCTPTGQRQYFDYRRANEGDGYNHRAGPTTRYYNSSSSSDIFPVTSRRDRKRGGGSSVISSSKSSVGYLRPTVHPQVVCDIPVKRLPYVVNFSRLSSSNMDLVSEHDRPRSGLGGNASVLSDNYRKDWVHQNSRGNGPARASSVISLHSAPPLSNAENFRHSSVDLTAGSVLQTPPLSPRHTKYYSTSPSASPVSHSRPLSSQDERFQHNSNGDALSSRLRATQISQEMWNGDCVTGNKTVVMLNSPPPPSSSPTPGAYQPAPAPYNRQKSFRPVDFNPPSNGGLSPAHAFHHASAKLTSAAPLL